MPSKGKIVLSFMLMVFLAAAVRAGSYIQPQDISPIVGGSTFSFVGAVSIGTNTNSTPLTVYGQITSSTTIGSLACSAGTPSLDAKSTDQAGYYLPGIAATNCTYTFAKSWKKAPVCICGTDAAAPIAVSATVTVSSVKCTAAAAMTGDNVTYICWGAP